MSNWIKTPKLAPRKIINSNPLKFFKTMKKLYSILAVVAMTSVANAQTNLVQNPGFENADLAPWAAGTMASYTAPTISTTEFKEGSKSAGYDRPSATTGFYQNVALEPNTEYVLSFWYKAISYRTAGTTQGNIFRIWSFTKDTTGTAVYLFPNAQQDPLRSNNGYLPLAQEWTKHEITFTTNDRVASIDFAFRVYGNGTAYVDDTSIVKKSDLSVVNVNTLEKSVKLNTVVEDKLTIFTAEKVTVNVYSLEGKLVSSNRVSNGESINFAGVQKGNYIVTIDNGSSKISKKIIKK